jgi:hypothetical protein
MEPVFLFYGSKELPLIKQLIDSRHHSINKSNFYLQHRNFIKTEAELKFYAF